MKTPAIIGTLAATAAFATTGCAMDFQADTFKTKEGKAVTITAIKHASLRIQYDGLEIQETSGRDARCPSAPPRWRRFQQNILLSVRKTPLLYQKSVMLRLGIFRCSRMRFATATSARAERPSRTALAAPTAAATD